MIRILMGVLPADSGFCRLGGVDPAVDPLKVRSKVGYLAEDQTMYGWMTPVELCRFLAPFYPTWDMKLARDSLDRFEIPSHTRIGRLSKGQVVKLGLVVALAPFDETNEVKEGEEGLVAGRDEEAVVEPEDMEEEEEADM